MVLSKEEEDELKEYASGEVSKKEIKKMYPKIVKILKYYCDLDERYYNIVALWILGTYDHNSFSSYPYLFFNAMRGSGKTRILKLISYLAYKGELMVSMSEAVLFRTAKEHTFCIDELERIASREKKALKELLNAAYKKGMKVKRAKRIKGIEEKYVIETFDVYCPIAMANIWGMEEVLSDRCITLTLEKSSNRNITRLMEDFETNSNILKLKEIFNVVSVVKLVKNNTLYTEWNNYINYIYNTNYTNNKYTKYTKYTKFFEKVDKTSLDSRHLELFFPLFSIAALCGDKILDETIKTAEWIVKQRRSEAIVENKDVALIDFLSQKEPSSDFIHIKEITNEFKAFLEEDDESSKWTNTRWFGRALLRLNLVIQKRRVGRGIEVVINYQKAKDKIKLFKPTIETPQEPTEKLPESDLEKDKSNYYNVEKKEEKVE